MLSGKVLKTLTQRSYVRDDLIELAWPSLCTESKLQILIEVQDNGDGSLTDKLFALAGTDDAPIVRFWSSLHSSAQTILSDVERAARRSEETPSWLWEHTEAAIDTANQLISDDNEMVAEISKLDLDWYEGPQEPLSETARLLAARFHGRTHISSMMTWIDNLWSEQAADENLVYQLVGEVLRSSRVKDEFDPEFMNPDGMSHFHTIGNAKDIWELATKLPKHAAEEIGYYAPLVVERTNIIEEVFDRLPPNCQAAALSRKEDGLSEVLKRVREHPENYDQEVVEQVERDDKYAFMMPSKDEISEARARNSADRDEALLDAVIQISKEVQMLREEMGQISTEQNGGFWRWKS